MKFLDISFIFLSLIAYTGAKVAHTQRQGKLLRGKHLKHIHNVEASTGNPGLELKHGNIRKLCKSIKASNSKSSGSGSHSHSVSSVTDCVAVDDMFFTKVDTSVVIADLLENDNKVEGSVFTLESYTDPSNGIIIDNKDGTFLYTPVDGFIGLDSYEYTVVNGLGQSFIGTVSITVEAINALPTANDDTFILLENTPVKINTADILNNDLDADGDMLIIDKCSEPKFGEVKTKKDGSFTYTPDDGFVGKDSIVCTIIDEKGGLDTSTIHFVVNSIDNEPFARNDIFVTSMGNKLTSIAPGILANDEGFKDGSLRVDSCQEANRGTLTYDENGSFTFIPNPMFFGIETIECSILNDKGVRETSNIIIFVRGPFWNDNNAIITDEDTPLTIEPQEILTSASANGDLVVEGCDDSTFGSLFQNEDGTFTYTPDADFYGDDLAECTATDLNGVSSTIVMIIEVRPVDDEPTAVDDNYSITMNTPITFNPVENDLNVDGNQELIIYFFTQPNDGVATKNDDGTLTYIPSNNFIGDDGFSYTVSDGSGGLSSATIMITVDTLNVKAIAVDDLYTTRENVALTTNAEAGILSNDSFKNGERNKVKSFDTPLHGSLSLNDNGSFIYTPNNNWSGEDMFEYTISDGNEGTASAIVIIIVDPVNDSLDAVDDKFTTFKETVLEVPGPGVLSNDKSANRIETFEAPLNGDLILDTDGGFIYTPNVGFIGTDSFEYIIFDSDGNSDTATVTLEVQMANTPLLIIPGGEDIIIIGGEGNTIKGVSSDCKGGNFTDCDGVGNASGISIPDNSIINTDIGK